MVRGVTAPAPRLRDIAVRPGEHEGRPGVFLRDPLGVARDTQFVPLSSWRVARALDGRASCAQIAETLNAEAEASLAEADVAAVVDGLSRRFLLEDGTFERALESDLLQFRDAGHRPLVGSGSDYEGNAFALRIQLGGLVADDWDMPPLPHAVGCLCPAARIADVRALYARSYASLRHARPQRIVLLAAAGMRLPSLCVPLDMDLETPFGNVAVDREGLAALGRFSGSEVLAHRDHLTIERHALFLRLLFRSATVVPLLIGSLDEGDPESAVEETLEGLRRVLALPGRTLLVCASELGAQRVGGPSVQVLRDQDAACIDLATRLDPEGFWRTGAETFQDERDERRALLSAPYLFLRALQLCERDPEAPPDPSQPDEEAVSSPVTVRGSTLGYRQFGPPGAVRTAASVVFH